MSRSLKSFFWPPVDDLWSAKKACIQASSAAFLIGAVTGTVTYLQLKGAALLDGINGGSFIDAAVFLILSFLIYRGSRIAAATAAGLYFYGQILMYQQTHRLPVTAVLFTVFLISGIRGAFGWHEMKKGMSAEEIKETLKTQREETDPQPSLKKRIAAWIVLILLVGAGIWIYKRNAPSMPGKGSHVMIQDAPVPAAPRPGDRAFKMKNGRTITGKVVADDPVYYTVETPGGKQEIVIKEDLSE